MKSKINIQRTKRIRGKKYGYRGLRQTYREQEGSFKNTHRQEEIRINIQVKESEIRGRACIMSINLRVRTRSLRNETHTWMRMMIGVSLYPICCWR
jgi:hypothetical protein